MAKKKDNEKLETDKEKLTNLKSEYAQKEQEKSPPETTESTSSKTDTETSTEIPRKRGRPKGSKNRPSGEKETPIDAIIPPSIVKALLKFGYSFVASKRGEFWNLTDVEAEQMTPIHLRLLAKYLPTYLQEHADLYTALLMHGMIVFARVELEMKLNPKEKEKPDNVGRENNTGETRYGQVNISQKHDTVSN